MSVCCSPAALQENSPGQACLQIPGTVVRLEGEFAGILYPEQYYFTKEMFFTSTFLLMASST